VDGLHARAVEPDSGRDLHVRLESIVSVSSEAEHVVNVRTHPDRNLAPERLQTEKST
jgi:hypothetical protein